MQLRRDVPLAPLTTLRLGGLARSLMTCETSTELVDAVRTHPDAVVLGGGSNVVLPDAGLDEVVLVRNRGITALSDALDVEAGEDWDNFVQHTLAEGYVGFEALSGIPGTVGASPIQNIGAYGEEVASAIVSVRVYDRDSDGIVDLPAQDCGFAYRSSVFKASPNRWVVLSVRFGLRRGAMSSPVRYAELAAALDVPLGAPAPALLVREAVLALRASKGMLLDAADPDTISAGSFFTNPLVSVAPEGAPAWPDPSGQVKVSAGWLIQQAGFDKGWGPGNVGLSTKHALALVNRGGATTAELLAVARQIREGVRERFDIELVNEPVIVGAAL